jgi:enterochelin esterase-like enzyme
MALHRALYFLCAVGIGCQASGPGNDTSGGKAGAGGEAGAAGQVGAGGQSEAGGTAGNAAGGAGGSPVDTNNPTGGTGGGTGGQPIGGTGGRPPGLVRKTERPASGTLDLIATATKADPAIVAQSGVPVGKLTKGLMFQSTVYGKAYQYNLYVPAQYKAGQKAAFAVYTDGAAYTDSCRVHVVMDNLIHTGEMPVTIAAFVYPLDRNREYVSNTDEFARFLKDDLFVEIGKTYDITTDSKMRMIVGTSSGGLVAFAEGWDHNELFKKTLGDSPSFATFARKDYPALVTSTRPLKDLRFVMTVGNMDNIDQFGDWFVIGKKMAAALESAKYDYRALLLKGDHGMQKSLHQMSDNLRWLWWDWDKP